MTKEKMVLVGAIMSMILVFGIVSMMAPPPFRTTITFVFVFLLMAAVSVVKRHFPTTTNANQDAVDLVVSRFPKAVPVQSLTGRSIITMALICVALWAVIEALAGFQLFGLPVGVHIFVCCPFFLCWLFTVLMGKRTLWLGVDSFVLESFFSSTRVHWKDVDFFEVRQTRVKGAATVPYVYCRMRGSNMPSSEIVIDKWFLSKTAEGAKLSPYDLDRIMETWRERAIAA
jgi:hypothetical protein